MTDERVRKFKCPSDKSQVFLWDKKAPGLGVRATKTAKAFIHQTRLGDRTIRIKIGDVRNKVLEDVRIESRKLQGLIDQGVDPRLEKIDRITEQNEKRKENIRKEIALSEVWPIYLDARKHQWSQRHYLDHIRIAHLGGEQVKRGSGKTKPGALASLMDCKLSDITPGRVRKWLQEESSKRGTQARIAFDALRAFINWLSDHEDFTGLISADACSRRIKKENLPTKKAKEDCLQKEQLEVWFQAVRGINNPVISVYLQGLLLTGARREELAPLKWVDLDFKWQAMTIHDKVEGSRTIPLTPYLASILNELPRRNKWIFSSPTSASGRIQEPRIAHNRSLAVAGIEGLTIHGLRRSFGTLSEWVECPVGVVAQIMGHKPSAIAEKHYRRRPLDLLRMWHSKIEKFILDEAGIAQPENGQTGLKVVGE